MNPVYISAEVKQDMIYIRKGTGTYPANRDDVLKMVGDYWQMRLEDVKELLTAQLQEREKDERENELPRRKRTGYLKRKFLLS